MSYILEALKKAERERRKDSVPDLQAHHTPYPAPGRHYSYPKKTVTLLIGSLVVLSMSALALFYLRERPVVEQNTSVTEAVVPAKQPESRQQVTTENSAETTLQANNIQQRQEVRQVQVEPQTVTVEPRPIIIQEETIIAPPPPASRQQEPQLPTYDDLAATINNFPRLSLAGHTYSDDPEQRMIIINSRIVREGQGLGNDLRLEEITWDGLILSFSGTRFTMKASQ